MTERQLAGLAIAFAALIPRAALNRTPTVCLFRRATGRPCPSCGLTRSWNATARLQLGRAFRIHPFGPLTFVAVSVFAIAPARVVDRPELRSARVLVPIGVLWLAAWLIRLVRAKDALASGS